MVRSERAGVAGQGQDRPGGDQTVVVISAPGEGSGDQELAGVHATVVDSMAATTMTAKTSNTSEIVFIAGKRDMRTLLR